MNQDPISKEKMASIESQIKEIEKEYDYRLVEWPIEVLISKFVKKEPELNYKDLISNDSPNSVIIVPDYQRDYVWQPTMKSKFIESIFMRVPMPPLFAFQLDEEGNLELVDGVQRLSTIYDFAKDKIILSGLEVLDSLNGFKFSELEIGRQKKFKNLSLKIYMLDEDTDEGIRADIFNRINSTGLKLNPAEIRKGSYAHNKFYDFILACTEMQEFSELFSSTKDEKLRGEKEELVTRFFAYSDQYENFDKSVKGFLDDYIKEIGKNFTEIIMEQKKMEFIKTLTFVKENFSFGFRKSPGSKSIPKTRFEAISIGVNLALREKPDLKDADLKWIDSKEFKEHVTSGSSNNKTKLLGRINFVKDCLLSKFDINQLNYEPQR